MALIKCPECKKKISDQCGNCPKCGYPIKASLKNNEVVLADAVTANEAADNTTKKNKNKRPIFKRVWFWIVVTVVVAIAASAVIFLLSKGANTEVKPKVNEAGKPVFVALTDEVYTNADEYLGYYVSVKGKVFQCVGDNGAVKSVQVWLDPDHSEQNLMIHYTTDETLNVGDYVICSGYIKEIHTYVNAYGTELYVPLIYSTDMRKATYIEVMSPTITRIKPANLTYKKYGYSITVSKVEFAKNETRLYLTVDNDGESTLRVNAGSSVIVQNGKQFNAQTNYEANYEQLPSSLRKGTQATGIIVFPAIKDDKLEFTIKIYSDNSQEKFSEITFTITDGGSFCETEGDEAWRMTALINTDRDDRETDKASISKYDSICFHLSLRGGSPNTMIRIKYRVTYPDGRTASGVFEEARPTNTESTWFWEGGIYQNPKYGTEGVLKVEFFDADTGERIGEETVQITE